MHASIEAAGLCNKVFSFAYFVVTLKHPLQKQFQTQYIKLSVFYVSHYAALCFVSKSFTLQLGPGQSLSKTPGSMCSLKSLEVNLKEVGWGRTVISPLSYQANYCSGSCSFPLSLAENPTNHATVLTILSRKAGLDLPAACCVPKKMDSLTILYFDTDGSVVLKTFPQMSVKSCGCR